MSHPYNRGTAVEFHTGKQWVAGVIRDFRIADREVRPSFFLPFYIYKVRRLDTNTVVEVEESQLRQVALRPIIEPEEINNCDPFWWED